MLNNVLVSNIAAETDSMVERRRTSDKLRTLNSVVYAIFATVSWFIFERAGRNHVLLWGTVGQYLSMVLVFSCLTPGTEAEAKGAAVGLFTYLASFGPTICLPLP